MRVLAVARRTRLLNITECGLRCQPVSVCRTFAAVPVIRQRDVMANHCVVSCLQGFECPFGSVGTQVIACPAGKYNANASECVRCADGTYNTVTGSSVPCTALCRAGYYGA
jgi:hypothetical protein